MPENIAKKYHQVFWETFLPRLPACKLRSNIVLPAFHESIGFAQSHIVLNGDGERTRHTWATNVIYNTQHGKQAWIEVNPELWSQPKYVQTCVLAKEWLEVMVGIRDGKSAFHSLVDNQIPMFLVKEFLGQQTPWADPQERQDQLDAAVHDLLVPTKRLEEYAAIKGHPFKSMAQGIREDPYETERIARIVSGFSKTYSVPTHMVWDRLWEVLGVR